MEKILEIKAAEGGEDSRMFVKQLFDAYIKLFNNFGWSYHLLVLQDNKIKIKINGFDLDCLLNEAGGHRVQRIPKTEKHGRVHTSTVTVSVVGKEENTESEFLLRDSKHYKIEWFSGTGKGGQHRNKHSNCARVVHLPTNLKREQQGKSRSSNLKMAMNELNKELDRQMNEKFGKELSYIKKNQVGSGMRGDKIRTYRFKEDVVKDHRSNKKSSCTEIMKGNFQLLW